MIQLFLFPYFSYPIGDDWSYLRALENLINGEINFLGWTSMPLIGQLVLASPFAFLIDDSILATRIASQFYMLLGMIWLWRLLPSANKQIIYVLLFNPLFLVSYGFMTDGYFAMSIIISLALAMNRRWLLSLGLFLLATSIRDISIVFIPIYGLMRYRENKDMREGLLWAGVYLFVFLGFTQLWRIVLENSTGGLPLLYDEGRRRLFTSLSRNPIDIGLGAAKNILATLPYLGIMILPIHLMMKKVYARKYTPLILGGIVAAIFFLIPENYFNELSASTAEIFSIIDLGNGNAFLASIGQSYSSIIIAISAGIGIWSLSELSYSIYHRKRALKWPEFIVENQLLIAIILYLLVLAPAGMFARYMFVPFVIYILAAAHRCEVLEWRAIRPRTLIILSVLFTHFLMLNKGYVNSKYIRTDLIEVAEHHGAKPENFDAGFEYSGYHNYKDYFTEKVEGKWWWVEDDKYTISPYVPSAYRILSTRSRYTYLPIETTLILKVRE